MRAYVSHGSAGTADFSFRTIGLTYDGTNYRNDQTGPWVPTRAKTWHLLDLGTLEFPTYSTPRGGTASYCIWSVGVKRTAGTATVGCYFDYLMLLPLDGGEPGASYMYAAYVSGVQNEGGDVASPGNLAANSWVALRSIDDQPRAYQEVGRNGNAAFSLQSEGRIWLPPGTSRLYFAAEEILGATRDLTHAFDIWVDYVPRFEMLR